ncbi:MAG: DUF899 domain-containing protein [Armatimonadetes bacterium]|nr:DUF899 domain-containing protein [Armatimonadota bacterium]
MITEEIKALEKEIEEQKVRLAELRRSAPADPVQDYELKRADGTSVKLSDLFGEYDEMLLIHNMGSGCSYCTLWADGFNAFWPYLKTKCAFVLTSPDPAHKMAQFTGSRDWEFPCVSLDGTSLVKDFGFDAEWGTWPGVTALKKNADGSITRHAQSYFGPGDDYCALWGLLDLLPGGKGDWEPNYNK